MAKSVNLWLIIYQAQGPVTWTTCRESQTRPIQSHTSICLNFVLLGPAALQNDWMNFSMWTSSGKLFLYSDHEFYATWIDPCFCVFSTVVRSWSKVPYRDLRLSISWCQQLVSTCGPFLSPSFLSFFLGGKTPTYSECGLGLSEC